MARQSAGISQSLRDGQEVQLGNLPQPGPRTSRIRHRTGNGLLAAAALLAVYAIVAYFVSTHLGGATVTPNSHSAGPDPRTCSSWTEAATHSLDGEATRR